MTQSSCEAELVSLNDAKNEAIWLRKAQRDFRVDTGSPMVIHEDNQAVIAISASGRKLSSRTKHFETSFFAIREHIDNGTIKVIYCPSTDMLADILTKPLAIVLFALLRAAIGIEPCP